MATSIPTRAAVLSLVRRRAGLTRARVAEMMGFSRATVLAYETDPDCVAGKVRLELGEFYEHLYGYVTA